MIGFWVLFIALDIVGRIPVIKGINKFAGLAGGLLEGVVVVWIVYLVKLMCSGYDWSKTAMQMIYQNEITKFLYNSNIILRIIIG